MSPRVETSKMAVGIRVRDLRDWGRGRDIACGSGVDDPPRPSDGYYWLCHLSFFLTLGVIGPVRVDVLGFFILGCIEPLGSSFSLAIVIRQMDTGTHPIPRALI